MSPIKYFTTDRHMQHNASSRTPLKSNNDNAILMLKLGIGCLQLPKEVLGIEY